MFWDKKSKEDKFWEWFEKNQDIFLAMKVDDNNINDIVKEVGKHLNKVNKGLSHEFSLKDENGKREFIISAGGVKKNVPAVEALYDAAPKLERWNILKYKPRKEASEMVMGPFKFTKDSIYFKAEKKDKINVILYFDDYKETLMDLYIQIGFIMMDATLGEYDVMTMIGEINWKSKDEAPEDAKPISQMAEYVDSFKNLP